MALWAATAVTTSSGNDIVGGTDVLRLLFLAFGGALVVGNVLALVRPPNRSAVDLGRGAAPVKPPLARSVTMIAIGMVAVVWALATLTSG